MSSFFGTLYKLYITTEKTEIYGLLALEDANYTLAFRRQIYDNKYKDPIIDGDVFMLCADAYYVDSGKKLEKPQELMEANLDDIEIRLRAQYSFPLTVISLGNYKITKRDLIDKYPDTEIPSKILLEIERKIRYIQG